MGKEKGKETGTLARCLECTDFKERERDRNELQYTTTQSEEKIEEENGQLLK